MTDIFGRFGAARVINATGTVTRLGASPIHPDVIAAMAEAAQSSVDIAELQGRASVIIASCTGAAAGIVTAGATAGLLVGAAACMTRFDPAKMSQLPDTTGMRNEFIVSRTHRNSYDHGVRAAGARLVEVGLPDRLTGCGVRDTEAWEYDAAIGDRTAGMLYLAGEASRPALTEVVRVAHAAGLPVMVDAAAQLPPRHNLRRFIEEGADLVVFSGGKALGGPSASGILCGRRDLVGAALLQQLDLDYVSEDWQPPAPLIDKTRLRGIPRHGIGRSCKVGKEQLVGLLVALQRFAEEEDAARNRHLHGICEALMRHLAALPLRLRVTLDDSHGGLPSVEITVPKDLDVMAAELPAATRPHPAVELAARLRAGAPALHVDATNADQGLLLLVPTCLTPADAGGIAAAFAAALEPSRLGGGSSHAHHETQKPRALNDG